MKISEPRSKFLKVECSKCGSRQVIFNKPSTRSKCRECGKVLCNPTGGLGDVKTKIKEVYR